MQPSGPSWCAQFPTGTSLDDLLPAYAEKCRGFLAAIDAGVGAEATVVNATWRPAERAYLMHWCCMIAKSGQDPAEVPAMEGVDIDWAHGGNLAAAKSAALQMMRTYGIVFPAALVSRHTQRRAMDVSILIPSLPPVPYSFVDAEGKVWHFGPADSASLYRFAATFGCIHLASDAPHFSDDGH